MSGPRISVDGGPEETRRKAEGGSRGYEAAIAFVAEGPVLVGSLRKGENYVRCNKPAWMVL